MKQELAIVEIVHIKVHLFVLTGDDSEAYLFPDLYDLPCVSYPPCGSTSRWPGVHEEAAAAVVGPQRADQHGRAAGRLHSAAPELLAQPPDERGGRGE